MKYLNHKQHLRTTYCFLIRLQGLFVSLVFAALIIILPALSHADGYTVRVMYYDNQYDSFWKNYGIFFIPLQEEPKEKTNEEFTFDTTYEDQSKEKPIHQLFITAQPDHIKRFPQDPIPQSQNTNDLPGQKPTIYDKSKKVSYIVAQKNHQVESGYILHLYTESNQMPTLLASINTSQSIYDGLMNEESLRDSYSENHPTFIQEKPEGNFVLDVPSLPQRTSSTTSSSYTSAGDGSLDSGNFSFKLSATPTPLTSNPLYVPTLPQRPPSTGYQTQPSSIQDSNLHAYEQIHKDHEHVARHYPRKSDIVSLPSKESDKFSSSITTAPNLVTAFNSLQVATDSTALLPQPLYLDDQESYVTFKYNNPTYEFTTPLNQPLCTAKFVSTVSFWLLSQSAMKPQPRWVINLIEALFKATTRNLQLQHVFAKMSPEVVRLINPSFNDTLASDIAQQLFANFDLHASTLTEWFEIYNSLGIDLMAPKNRDHTTSVDLQKACDTVKSVHTIMGYYYEGHEHAIYDQHGHIPPEIYWTGNVLERHQARLEALKEICDHPQSNTLPLTVIISEGVHNTIGAIQKLVTNTYNYLPSIFLTSYIRRFLQKAIDDTPPITVLESEPEKIENSPQHLVSEAIAQAHAIGLEKLPKPLFSSMEALQAWPLPKNPLLVISSNLLEPYKTLATWPSIPHGEKLKRTHLMQLGAHLNKVKIAADHFQCASPPNITCNKSVPKLLAHMEEGQFTTHKRKSLSDIYKPKEEWFPGEKESRSQRAIQTLNMLQHYYFPHSYTTLLYEARAQRK